MLDNVRKHLEDKGIDPSVLDDYANDGVEESVEVDALTEALDTLAKAMKKEDKPQRNLFDMDEELEDDEELDDDEDLEKGYYADAMKALAQGTDDVIANMEKRMGAVMKGLEAVLGEMKKMYYKHEDMEKSLNSVLNSTTAPRAITSAPVVSTPAVETPNRNDMIRKGLDLLQSNDVDTARKTQIRTAIAQLEAGVSVNSVSHIFGK